MTSALASFGQSFNYDNVNRLHSVTDPFYTRSFSYDQYGNMSVSGATGLNPNAITPVNSNGNPVNPANNELVSASYDATGNQLSFAAGAYAMQYDAENHQTQLYDTVTRTEVQYVYDGAGQRVAKIAGDNTRTIYIYDALGRLATEYSPTASSSPACQTCYLTRDYLGSLKVVTDANQNVISLHDYTPFGEEIYSGSAGRSAKFGQWDGLSQRFIGQERD